MNRIFYIHSNILAICCYETVKNALERKEKVIIVSNRKSEWPFFKDKVKFYDFADIFEGEDKQRVALHSISAIMDYIRYRRYIKHLHKVVNQVIACEDYYFYMPSMALDMTLAFAYHKHCKGYYYVDEGSLAYLPQDIINAQFSSSIKNTIKRLLYIEDHCHYEIRPSFKGTISLTADAFRWNTEYEKIVNPIDECVLELKNSLPEFDEVIVTAKLTEDIKLIIKSIDYTIATIFNRNPDSKIGIKLHPNAVTYNKEKVSEVLHYIKEEYDDRVKIIPREVSIEAMSLVYHPKLYSLFVLSSLLLYGLLFKSSECYLIKEELGCVSILQIASVDEYYQLIRKINLGQ